MGRTAAAVASGEVAALAHELLDDSVESGALVVQRLAGVADTLLAGAQSTEVLSSVGDNVGSIEAKKCGLISEQQQRNFVGF